MDAFRRFIGELKRRNVVRVAGVYAVTAWGLFQIANTLFQVFQLPVWAAKLLVVLLIVGFPLALIIAWAFETSPDGIRRTRAADAPPRRFAVLDWVLVAATVAIIGIFTVQATGAWRAPGRAMTSAGAPAAAGAKSIAVLPFANFSDSRDAEFFADGLTEEVINSLAKTPDLKVAGRTSSFYYKGKNHDLRQVGRQLGVEHVLEGSIRRGGDNRIRITAQLIKVSDGFHLWSETYDRDVSDTFAVQTEIAETVAGVMKTKLLAQSGADASNPEAYRLVLTARGRIRQLGQENIAAARGLYERAIKLDPNNAEAHAGLAQSLILLAQNHMAMNFEEARRQAEAEISRALRIQADSVPAHLASGFLNAVLSRRIGDPRFAQVSERAYARALQLDPRNPDVLTYYGGLLNELGREEEAIPILDRALESDPLNRVALSTKASALAGSGKGEEAIGAYQSVIRLYPDFVDASEQLGWLLADLGRLDEAEPHLIRAAQSKFDPTAAVLLAHLYFNLGLYEDGRAVLARVREPPMAVNIMRAIDYMIRRDYQGLLTFTEAQYARDKDPFWPSAIALAALHLGDDRKAIEQVRQVSPEMLTANPQIGTELDVALSTAHGLNGLGLKDQARRLLDKVLEATEPEPGTGRSPVSMVRRAQAYAELGDRQRALAELRQAVDRGFRSLYDFEDFVRLEENLNFQNLRTDPAFRALIARIEADNARMRARVLAQRNGGRQT